MVYLKKCTLSCDLFWGYSVFINIEEYNTKDSIVSYILKSLMNDLKTLNLVPLYEKLQIEINSNKFHIHESLYNILDKNEDIIYVCNHECNGM